MDETLTLPISEARERELVALRDTLSDEAGIPRDTAKVVGRAFQLSYASSEGADALVEGTIVARSIQQPPPSGPYARSRAGLILEISSMLNALQGAHAFLSYTPDIGVWVLQLQRTGSPRAQVFPARLTLL